MAELVDEIIASNVKPDLDGIISRLETIESLIGEVNTAGKGMLSEIKAVNNVAGLNEVVAKSTALQGQFANTLEKTSAIIASKNGKSLEWVSVLKKVEEAELVAAKAADVRAKASERASKQAEADRKREEKATKELTGEYAKLNAEHKKLVKEASDLGAKLGVESAEFKKVAAAAEEKRKALLKVDLALGNARREVGKYNQATFAMTQIMREVPSIANGLPIFLSAIGNNIAGVQDAVKSLNETNKELVANGAKAIPVWKTLAGAIFNWQTAILLGITALTIWAQKTDLFTSKTDEAKKAADEFKKSMSELRAELSRASEEEIDNMGRLMNTMKSLELPYATRISAMDELIKKYPQLLKYIDQEAFLNGKTGNTLAVLSDVVQKESYIKEIEADLKNLYKTKFILQQGVDKGEGFLENLTGGKSIIPNEQLQFEKGEHAKAVEQLNELNKKIKYTQDSLSILKRELEFAVNPKRVKGGRILEDIDADIKSFERIRDMSVETSKAHQNSIVQIRKLNEERSRYLGKEEKDNEFKGESSLLKAQYDLDKQRIEQDKDTQKEIAENEKEEMGDRLVASQQLTTDEISLAKLERDLTIDIENSKVEELERKRKTASTKQRAFIDEEIRAAYIRINAAQEKFATETNKALLASKKKDVQIIASANDEWIKDEETAFARAAQLQLTGLLAEEKLLKDAYDKKQIKRREFNKRLEDLQKQQHEVMLNAEIEFDRKILSNANITTEKRVQYEKKLATDLEALGKLKSEKAPQKRTGRITDGIAAMLIPTEADEQYLQEFYDRTIALANQAADAIIAAKNRQYDAEKARLDEQKEGIRRNYEEQVAAINATTRNATDRANKLSKLAAQTAAQEAAIEQQKRKVAQDQARFQRTASIAAIIQNTAVAIAGALKYGVAAPPIIALIAGAGAVQLAAVANSPIPAYKHGTLNHPGGAFIAGDGGKKELIVEPSGKSYMSSNVATLYDAPQGTMVLPPEYFSSNTNMPRLEDAKRAYEQRFLSQQISVMVGKEFRKVGEELKTTMYATMQQPQKLPDLGRALRNHKNFQGK